MINGRSAFPGTRQGVVASLAFWGQFIGLANQIHGLAGYKTSRTAQVWQVWAEEEIMLPRCSLRHSSSLGNRGVQDIEASRVGPPISASNP